MLGHAPWDGGITKEELIDYAERNNATPAILDELRQQEDDGEIYYELEDLVGEVPTSDIDFCWYDEDGM